MATTTHCAPKACDNSLISSGRLTADELMDTLSAPFLRSMSTSATLLIPPPTVKGMSTVAATFSTKSAMVFLPCSVADMSKNTSSSAPVAAYLAANSTGSPASLSETKLTPFTVRPSLISKQGIILFVNMRRYLK